MAATTEPTVDANGASNSAVQAAKKKKTKKVVADNTKYQGIESVMPVVLKSSHAKGRHATAARDLPAGTLVSVEKPAAAIVRNQSFVNLCHHCFSPVTMKTHMRPKLDQSGNEVKGQKEKVALPAFSCGKCKMAAYCSEKCQTDHAKEHNVQCDALAQCNRIATAHKVPLENLRAVLALIGRRAVTSDLEADPKFAASTAEAQPTNYGCVLDLNPNRHYIGRDAIKDLQAALKEMLALVSADSRIPLSEAVEVACIFKSNDHPLVVNNQHISGLYPFSALYFHHSCMPNCVYVCEKQGALYVRTLADVPAESELTITYVELYQPREQRRRDLLLTRHFWCKCRRCSTPLSQSVDRFMDGIQCSECKRGVMIFEETKEVEDINELMTDISALDQEIQGKYAECETCPAKIEVTKLVDLLKAAITDYSNAHMTIQQGDLPKARHLMERFVTNYEDKHILHPSNAYLINTYTSLSRVCNQLGDVDRAIRYTTIVVERTLGAGGDAVPENYPRLSEYYMSLGDMCLKQAKKKAANRTPAGRSITRRYLKEAKSSLESAYKTRKVIYGDDSQKAAEALKLLESAKKEYDEFVKATEKKKPKKPSAAPVAAPQNSASTATPTTSA
ncbi:hypothetical protein H4R24_000599 [Coemansia sp. RSA 988]|nr:hypothetical protein H4R24_000599 [Coemansia sp. RSA 988]